MKVIKPAFFQVDYSPMIYSAGEILFPNAIKNYTSLLYATPPI